MPNSKSSKYFKKKLKNTSLHPQDNVEVNYGIDVSFIKEVEVSESLNIKLNNTSNLSLNNNVVTISSDDKDNLNDSEKINVSVVDVKCHSISEADETENVSSNLCTISNSKFKRCYGKVYKQRLLEKYKGKKSHYFKKSVTLSNSSWIPPRSPYCLIQEDLYHSPWQLLIATIFLTKTHAKKAIPQILNFLERWPNPEALIKARQEEIVQYLKPLGIQYVRSSLIRKFTEEFLTKEWTYPEELHGIGKYGNDSYRIFCVNEWRHVSPEDNKLNLYKNWLTENAEKLGL